MVARGSVLRFVGALCASLAGLVFAAGPVYAASAPVVERLWTSEWVWASEVNRSTARINAVINPSGADTTYHFEYGRDTAYGSSVPVPDGDLSSGAEGVEVSQLLAGLQAGVTYHYRIVATNSFGTTEGEDETFTTFTASGSPSADSCPNAVYRVEHSAGLPDCRAYEMVSPVEKYGGDVAAEAYGQTLASERGDGPGAVDRAVFTSKTGFGQTHGSGNAGYTQYVAERQPYGWVTRGITPAPNAANGGQVFGYNTEAIEFSSDLSIAGLLGYSLPEGPATARPNSENLYLEDTTASKLFGVITDASNEGEPFLPSYFPSFYQQRFGAPALGGASPSLDVVTFASRVNFVPEVHGYNYKAYVYEHGVVKLLGWLPDGSIPPEGSELVYEVDSRGRDGRAIEEKDTVSSDGSRILFAVNERPGQLFMRKNGTTSILVTESETSEPVTAEDVHLEAATPDLKHIVFETSTRLLDNAPEGGGLYMYTDSPDPESESNLTYIDQPTKDAVLGISDDGTHVYYIDKSAYSLKVWNAGQTSQIAPASGVAPPEGLAGNTNRSEARVIGSGRELVFASPLALTKEAHPFGITNGNPYPFLSGRHNTEIYLYTEDTNTLKCVSCPITGAEAAVGAETGVNASNGGTYLNEPYPPRFVSSDGHYIFFNTTEALVPQDTNGTTDAYEYNTATTQLSLLSTGTGEDDAWFVDASADGHDVFLATRQKLTRWDPDRLVDVYDVRVDGGLPEPAVSGVPCTGDACQGTPSAVPSFNTASGFTGLGNLGFTASASVKTRAKLNERLRHALAVCRAKPRAKRARCERWARKRYWHRRSAVRNSRAGR